MILAAGEGTRLRPLTLALPKPMVPVVGVPLLRRTLDWLAGSGVSECAINLYHRPQIIPDTFGAEFAGMRLHYFFEDALRGTAGGVKAASGLLGDAPFFVIYGDNLIHADLSRLRAFHAARSDAAATITLFRHPNPTQAGIVGLAEDQDGGGTGRITRFVEKPPPDGVFSDWANAGVYVLDPSVLDAIPQGRASDFGRDIFPALLAQGRALYGTPLGGYLQDTGTPESYRRANWDLLAGRAGLTFPDPHLWIDPSARIGPGAAFAGRNVVGAGAAVGAGASVTDCILVDKAQVGPGEAVRDMILGDGFRLSLSPSSPA